MSSVSLSDLVTHLRLNRDTFQADKEAVLADLRSMREEVAREPINIKLGVSPTAATDLVAQIGKDLQAIQEVVAAHPIVVPVVTAGGGMPAGSGGSAGYIPPINPGGGEGAILGGEPASLAAGVGGAGFFSGQGASRVRIPGASAIEEELGVAGGIGAAETSRRSAFVARQEAARASRVAQAETSQMEYLQQGGMVDEMGGIEAAGPMAAMESKAAAAARMTEAGEGMGMAAMDGGAGAFVGNGLMSRAGGIGMRGLGMMMVGRTAIRGGVDVTKAWQAHNRDDGTLSGAESELKARETADSGAFGLVGMFTGMEDDINPWSGGTADDLKKNIGQLKESRQTEKEMGREAMAGAQEIGREQMLNIERQLSAARMEGNKALAIELEGEREILKIKQDAASHSSDVSAGYHSATLKEYLKAGALTQPDENLTDEAWRQIGHASSATRQAETDLAEKTEEKQANAELKAAQKELADTYKEIARKEKEDAEERKRLDQALGRARETADVLNAETGLYSAEASGHTVEARQARDKITSTRMWNTIKNEQAKIASDDDMELIRNKQSVNLPLDEKQQKQLAGWSALQESGTKADAARAAVAAKQDQDRDQNWSLRTAGVNAQIAGQRGMGQVLNIASETEQGMEDPATREQARTLGIAQLESFLTPQRRPSIHTGGLQDWNDKQMSISGGAGEADAKAEARKMLDLLSKGQSVVQELGNAAKDLAVMAGKKGNW